MRHRSRQTAKLHKIRQESHQRGERITELERAFRRLQDLHDVSKLLTSFESAERTVPRVIALIARALALRSAIFLLGTDAPLTIEWQSETDNAATLTTARSHATSTYEYLLRARSTVPVKMANDRAFVVLPLVVDHSIFGALQVEGTAALDEHDLTFVNAVVNQLAIALDRAAAITAQRVAVETDEKYQHVLADLGAGLITAGGLREAFAALARSVVPRVADVCLIDELHDDGSSERLIFSTDTELSARLQDCPRLPGIANRPVLMSDISPRDPGATGTSQRPVSTARGSSPLMDGIIEDNIAGVLQAAGVKSTVIAPLVARGRTLGAMTLGVVGASRAYTKRDLSFAVEVANRAAFGIDNIRLHEETRRTAEELRRAVQLREDVLAIVSHDLRNPLSAVHSSAQMLQEKHGQDARSRKQLATLQRGVSRMERMIDDLLDMASIQTGRFSLDRSSIDATKLVTETLDDLEPAVSEKGITIQRDIEPRPHFIRADARRLIQVFGNLIGNAKKFCRSGDVIRVGVSVMDHVAQFVVEDTGPGIPAAELPHIFEPYWSAKRHEREGTGLGLYISKSIIEAHGGQLWVESKLGEGTKFFFRIPLT
jgi:signal transduction histidine kinase